MTNENGTQRMNQCLPAFNRYVTRHEPDRDKRTTFSEYLSDPYIILLGDPGMGKTYTFQSFASCEGGVYMTVRAFLATRGKGCEGGILYLDALDEYRSRTADGNLIITLLQYLSDLDLKCLRISCRAADWFGSSDLELFRGFFGDKKYAVLGLNSLTRTEVLSILEEENRVTSPEDFYMQAEKRGLEGLLGNPQTLKMLAELVCSEDWPESRTELFDKSAEKLLSEVPSRARDELGKYSFQELMFPAGAVCCTLLISNVAGISLLSSSECTDFPSYRNLNFDEYEKIQASLTRRAFQLVDQESESFSYIHRTIAEYLAAKWIVSRIRGGYPILRFKNLIGIEGVPTSELRGLYAWVATLLPEYAMNLIEYDPLGVVLYGDSEQFTSDARMHLFQCIEKVSKEDPWFRKSANWASGALGALSSEDLVEKFESILDDPNTGFHLKDLVLTSVLHGKKFPALTKSLSSLLINESAHYSERNDAAEILIAMEGECVDIVVNMYHQLPRSGCDSLALRVNILKTLYPTNFSYTDICNVIRDYVFHEKCRTSHDLWRLEDCIPIDHAIQILDAIPDYFSGDDIRESEDSFIDVPDFLRNLSSKVLESDVDVDVAKVFSWLLFLYDLEMYENRDNSKSTDTLRKWFARKYERKNRLIEYSFKCWGVDKSWSEYCKFTSCTFGLYAPQEIVDFLLDFISREYEIDESFIWLYGLSGQLIFAIEPPDQDRFVHWAELRVLSNKYPGIYEETVHCSYEDWGIDDRNRGIEFEKEKAKRRKKELDAFEETKDLIKSGKHRHNLYVLALHYFNNLTVDVSPVLSIVDRSTEELLPFVLDGFYSSLFWEDLPSPYEIGRNSINRSGDWYTVLAGMNEAWRRRQDLSLLPEKAISAALAISFTLHVFIRQENQSRTDYHPPWVSQVISAYPDLSVESVFQLSRGALDINHECNDGISALLRYIPEDMRADSVLNLISEFPSMHQGLLRRLTVWLLCFSKDSFNELKEIVKQVITKRGRVKGEQRATWLVVGCFLDFGVYKDHLEKYMKTRAWVCSVIHDFMDSGYRNRKPIEMSIFQCKFIAFNIARHYQNCNSRSEGWGRSTAWDMSELVKALIHKISSDSSSQATEALQSLKSLPQMETYVDDISHSLCSQIRLSREAKYMPPNWSETVKVLNNEEPSNVADLHALLIDHIDQIKIEIRNTPTSIFRRFWRHGKSGILEVPDIEDHCRDNLIDLIKPRLSPLGVRVEPECHMADNKRADIVAYLSTKGKVPMELKRDFHPDLWTACENQLEKLYTPDSEVSGYGIYIVFWFGKNRGSSMPKVPSGYAHPQTSEELEDILNSCIAVEKRHRLVARVIDVSGTNNSKGQSKVKGM